MVRVQIDRGAEGVVAPLGPKTVHDRATRSARAIRRERLEVEATFGHDLECAPDVVSVHPADAHGLDALVSVRRRVDAHLILSADGAAGVFWRALVVNDIRVRLRDVAMAYGATLYRAPGVSPVGAPRWSGVTQPELERPLVGAQQTGPRSLAQSATDVLHEWRGERRSDGERSRLRRVARAGHLRRSGLLSAGLLSAGLLSAGRRSGLARHVFGRAGSTGASPPAVRAPQPAASA